MDVSDEIYESSITYDGDNRDVDCKIKEKNEGKICDVRQ
jgi:hypothetical protein